MFVYITESLCYTPDTQIYTSIFFSLLLDFFVSSSFSSSSSFFFFCFLGATLTAYGSFQARSQIGAAAAILHHSHSNVGSELLTETPNP